MVTGEVDIDIRLATTPPITQVGLLDCQISLLLIYLSEKVFMAIREVEICLLSHTFLPITAVGNTFPRQGRLKKIFLGLGE